MKKYIHLGNLQTQSKKQYEKSTNLQTTYRYHGDYDDSISPKSTLPRNQNSTYTDRRQQSDEIQTPGTRNRTNTQRTFNQKCKNDISPSHLYDERQAKKEMEVYIFKLEDIKTKLEKAIAELQKMLDNTSKYVSEVDSEYQHIKATIMEYTSRCLDNAFKLYKKGMPRWSKYQQVEKKGLKIVVELNQFIEEQTHVYQQVKQDRATVNLSSNTKQLISRTAHYNVMATEIHKMIEQCEAKHPTIREDKVKQFQLALSELCTF